MIKFFPIHVCCLDQGLIYINPNNKNVSPYIFPLMNGENFLIPLDNELVKFNGEDWCTYNGEIYPFTEIDNNRFIIDQSKTLLNFVMFLSQLLQRKNISPRLDLRTSYLTQDLLTVITIIDNKLTVINK